MGLASNIRLDREHSHSKGIFGTRRYGQALAHGAAYAAVGIASETCRAGVLTLLRITRIAPLVREGSVRHPSHGTHVDEPIGRAGVEAGIRYLISRGRLCARARCSGGTTTPTTNTARTIDGIATSVPVFPKALRPAANLFRRAPIAAHAAVGIRIEQLAFAGTTSAARRTTNAATRHLSAAIETSGAR